MNYEDKDYKIEVFFTLLEAHGVIFLGGGYIRNHLCASIVMGIYTGGLYSCIRGGGFGFVFEVLRY